MTGACDKADWGDTDAGRLEHAYDTYASGLLRYARALLGSAEDAEDAVQEVFVRLARDAKALRNVDNLRSYLLKSTRNAAYGIFRGRRKRERIEEAAVLDLVTCPPEGCGPEIEAVLKAFDELPLEQKEVLALKVFQGLTFREIAEVIGKSQNTVSSRYRYAIERIRTIVGEE